MSMHMSMNFGATAEHKSSSPSPFRNTGNMSIPPYSMRSSPIPAGAAAFTPIQSSSPSRQNVKRSKLSISTSSLRLHGGLSHQHNDAMNRSASGIALGSASNISSSPYRYNRSGINTPLMSSTGNLHVGNQSVSRSGMLQLPPSSFYASHGSALELQQTTHVDPSEAKGLYYAHYNGLEVRSCCLNIATKFFFLPFI
jgi:hypothetical protein